jgi:hypothetical protein
MRLSALSISLINKDSSLKVVPLDSDPISMFYEAMGPSNWRLERALRLLQCHAGAIHLSEELVAYQRRLRDEWA